MTLIAADYIRTKGSCAGNKAKSKMWRYFLFIFWQIVFPCYSRVWENLVCYPKGKLGKHDTRPVLLELDNAPPNIHSQTFSILLLNRIQYASSHLNTNRDE